MRPIRVSARKRTTAPMCHSLSASESYEMTMSDSSNWPPFLLFIRELVRKIGLTAIDARVICYVCMNGFNSRPFFTPAKRVPLRKRFCWISRAANFKENTFAEIVVSRFVIWILTTTLNLMIMESQNQVALWSLMRMPFWRMRLTPCYSMYRLNPLLSMKWNSQKANRPHATTSCMNWRLFSAFPSKNQSMSLWLIESWCGSVSFPNAQNTIKWEKVMKKC